MTLFIIINFFCIILSSPRSLIEKALESCVFFIFYLLLLEVGVLGLGIVENYYGGSIILHEVYILNYFIYIDNIMGF